LILVFGASGFLGSAIANHLSIETQVIAVTRPQSINTKLQQMPQLKIVRAEEHLWPTLVERYKADVVICAQWDGTRKSMRNSQPIQTRNLQAIIDIALIAKANQCKKFIALGSQAESAESNAPIPERYLNSGNDWYGKTKSLLCSKLMKIFEESQTSFIWARVFSIYGPGADVESLVPELLRASIDGNQFTVNNPTKLWSFLYISDFAAAIEALLKISDPTTVVNVAHPELITIKKICENLPNSHIVYSKSDLPSNFGYFPVISKLRNLEWRPKISITAGCKITTESF
jgi:nucleoside-diphosphate-sugar epimerase